MKAAIKKLMGAVLMLSFIGDFEIAVASSSINAPELAGAEYFKKANIFFPNVTATIPVAIPNAVQCQNLRPVLYLAAEVLATPVVTDATIECGENPRMANVQLSSPESSKTTRYILLVEECAVGVCKDIETLELSVVSKNILEPVARWAKEYMILIMDDDGKIEEVLAKNNIEFTLDESLALADATGELLTVISVDGRPSQKDIAKYIAKGPVIIFYKTDKREGSQFPSTIPLIYHNENDGHCLIATNLPIAEYLLHNALAASLFLDLFYSCTSGRLQ